MQRFWPRTEKGVPASMCNLVFATDHHVYRWASLYNPLASKGRRVCGSCHCGFPQISSVEVESARGHHRRGGRPSNPRIYAPFILGQTPVSNPRACRAAPTCSLLYHCGVQQFPAASLDVKVRLTGGHYSTGVENSTQTCGLRCWLFPQIRS